MQTGLRVDTQAPMKIIPYESFHSLLEDFSDDSIPIDELVDGYKHFYIEGDFLLESGKSLKKASLAYETWGTLNKDKSNAILIHHALSVGCHVSSTQGNSENGWWQDMVGPGKAIDTSKYFVICINNLGSCFGSSGPLSLNPETNEAYKYDFPQVTVGDMVNSQKLLTEHLKIKKLYAVIGSSMGAMLSLTWAVEYPDSAENLILISSSYKAYPANIANRNIQHQAILLDPMWQQGHYRHSQELSGFKVARKLGLFTYKNSFEWDRRFNSHGEPLKNDSDVIDYFNYNADKFCKVFDANSYLKLIQSMDLFDVTKNYASSHDCFSRVRARTLVISVESDILFTPQQQLEKYNALKTSGVDCSYINHRSQYGHDAFLVEIEAFTGYVAKFLNS